MTINEYCFILRNRVDFVHQNILQARANDNKSGRGCDWSNFLQEQLGLVSFFCMSKWDWLILLQERVGLVRLSVRAGWNGHGIGQAFCRSTWDWSN